MKRFIPSLSVLADSCVSSGLKMFLLGMSIMLLSFGISPFVVCLMIFFSDLGSNMFYNEEKQCKKS